MIGMLTIILVCVASISGNPAAGKPWHWKSPKPLVDPKGPGKIPAKTSRIGDGTEATPHSWPHQVALLIDYIHFCGGSLISNEWVLTAASCMDDCERVGFVVVVMGAHNINEVEASQVEMNSTVFICHENWNSRTLSNDIALIRLPSPVSFNDNIRPVKLPSADDVTVGITVTPTGWMDPHIGKSCRMSDALLQVDVNIKSVSNEYICPYNTGGEIICRGDSGGPLNYNGTIVGIASFGSFARCEDDYPYVFTKVYSYLDWIKSKTEGTP